MVNSLKIPFDVVCRSLTQFDIFVAVYLYRNNIFFHHEPSACCRWLIPFIEVNTLSAKRNRIPNYGTVNIIGHIYFRTMVTDANGHRFSLYGKTREELYDKEINSMEQIKKHALYIASPVCIQADAADSFPLSVLPVAVCQS